MTTQFRIDKEFRDLIPPLSQEEFAQLEQSILAEGVRDPLVVWSTNGSKPILVEGHHRWQIIKKHKITKYRSVEKTFPDRDAVKVYIIENQCGRRNITRFTRCCLHLQRANILRQQAKENQRLSKGRGKKGGMISSRPFHLDDELAKQSGVSRQTLQRVRFLVQNSDSRTISALEQGETTINEGFKATKRRITLQEAEAAIPQTEIPKLPSDCQIICGDCRREFPRLRKKHDISLILFDPPYNVSFRGYEGYQDDLSDEEYTDLLRTFKGDTPLAICQYPEEMMRYVVPALGPPDEVLTWVYPSNLPRQTRLINIYNAQPDFDRVKQPYRNPDDPRIASLIQMGVRGAKSYDWIELDIVKNVAKAENPHPSPVPQQLFEWLILLLTNEGDTIYDPFMGLGSSMLAAQALGRVFLGTEINPKYIETAKRRLAMAREDAREGREKTSGTVTAHVGNNAVLFREVAQMYLKPNMKVADVTYGKGVFWREVDTSRFDFHPSDIHTSSKCPYDFRNLPYDDESFDAVVFDPPYAHDPGQLIVDDNYANAATTHRMYHKKIMELYRDGMQEARRVLKRGGLLMVKCQDEIESSSQRRSHIEVHQMGMDLGFRDEDLFVLVQSQRPTIQHADQQHARKNHSFLWVLKKQSP